MPTLVIVDMQPVFANSFSDVDELIDSTIRLVKHARQKKWGIIILEYRHSCESDITYDEITKKLKGYPLAATALKQKNDGSEAVLKICKERSFCTKHFLFGGVNGGACVKSTVLGIVDKSPKSTVAVAPEAIRCCSGGTGLNWTDRYPQVKKHWLKRANRSLTVGITKSV